MKIKSLVLENFKSFKKLEIKDFLDVNMIYGYNNSGKSNLLKFLELVFSAPEAAIEMVVEGQKKFVNTTTETQNFWEKNLYNMPYIFRRETGKRHDITFSVSLEVTKSELEKAMNKGYEAMAKQYITSKEDFVGITFEGKIMSLGDYNAQQSLTKVVLDGKEIFILDQDGNKKTFEGAVDLTFSHFTNLMLYFNDCVLFLDNDRYFVNELEDHDGKKLHSKNFKNTLFNDTLSHTKEEDLIKLTNFIRKFKITSEDGVIKNNEKSSPFNNFSFEFGRFNDEIEIMLRNTFGRFPLSSFGTGIQQLVYILSRVFLASKKIVVIEEIELNLSPKYQTELIDFMYKKLIKGDASIDQLFYTTHSPLMCFRTEFRSMEARIDGSGISTIEKIVPSKEDVQKFKDAHDLLERFPDPQPKKQAAAGQNGNG